MFIPLFDFEERDRWEDRRSMIPKLFTPMMTLVIVICVLVFIYQTFFVRNDAMFYRKWGAIPYELLKSIREGEFIYFNLITYAFVHGGFFHLLGNMWFFFIFGNNVERRLGSFIFILFYLSSAIISALIHMVVLFPEEMLGMKRFESISPVGEMAIPLVGASGAVSAVLGAYMKYFPRNYVATLVIFFIITVIPISASIFIGVWLVGQIMNAVFNPQASIAWFAHLGGFAYGYLFASIYKGKREYYYES